MSFSFNSQIKKLNNKADTTEYSIQITTDNYEQFLFIQEMARQCVDGKHKEKQGDTETFAEHYGCLPTTWTDIELPNVLEHSDIPNCCKACPNHPSNGGSGICNCTAPYFEQNHHFTCTAQTSAQTSDNIRITF